MTIKNQGTSSIWQALDAWARTLKPWQRAILAHAISSGRVADDQIDGIYDLFLQEVGLKEKQARSNTVALDVSGRPATVLSDKLLLHNVGDLVGINALPAGSSLTFGAGLT